MNLIDNLIGKRFGLLTVLAKDYEKTKEKKTVYWICQCDCGAIKSIQASNLKRKDENRIISCGCSKRSSGEIYIMNLLDSNNIRYIS